MKIIKNISKTKSEKKFIQNPKQKYLSINQVVKLIDSINDMRDKLLVSILYESGCSLNELVNIKVRDISEGKIKIINPDSKQERQSRISKKLTKKILLFASGNNLDKESYLISTKNREKISEKRVRQLVQHYSMKSGNSVINPMMIRYYHIAHAYLNGVSIDNIAFQLGLTKYRIFQILGELAINLDEDLYGNFLINFEEKNENGK